jgi:uncharacterized membrane protein YeaQ/YmgE (transglycosylase-associated protein family)
MDLAALAQEWTHTLLLWIGYGTVVGLVAKAVLPGRDPGGALATVITGVLGSLVGAGILVFLWDGARVTPISPLGFVVATAGAGLLLLVYRLLAGKLFTESGSGFPPVRFRLRRNHVSLLRDE